MGISFNGQHSMSLVRTDVNITEAVATGLLPLNEFAKGDVLLKWQARIVKDILFLIAYALGVQLTGHYVTICVRHLRTFIHERRNPRVQLEHLFATPREKKHAHDVWALFEQEVLDLNIAARNLMKLADNAHRLE